MQNYLLIGSFLGSLGAFIGVFVSALFASWAAKETQKTSLAYFILEDRRTYGSPEMLRAMMRLIEWQKQNPEDYVEKFGELRDKDYPRVKDVDEARRRFAHYFTLPETLLKFKFINKELTEELRPKHQVDFYLKLVKPLAGKIKIVIKT